MIIGAWEERVLEDRLLEVGPSRSNQDFKRFSYLDFQNAGRIHNVSVLNDLESKLIKSIGTDNFTAHFIGKNDFSNETAENLLFAIGHTDGITYAADPNRIGIEEEIRESRAMYKSGTVQKYLGLFIGLIGIPLTLAIVGSVMIVAGFFMWRSGNRTRNLQASKIELLELQQRLTKNISKVHLL